MLDLHEGTAAVFAEAQSFVDIPDRTEQWVAYHRERSNERRRLLPAVYVCMCPVCGGVFERTTQRGRPQVHCSRLCAMVDARREYTHRVWESRAVCELWDWAGGEIKGAA